ncbi:hypothetical protein B566_EDAN009531 [Ephemera danica]|nr:hypothetical protein B566_EDAN009531 [Ephemera danica]
MLLLGLLLLLLMQLTGLLVQLVLLLLQLVLLKLLKLMLLVELVQLALLMLRDRWLKQKSSQHGHSSSSTTNEVTAADVPRPEGGGGGQQRAVEDADGPPAPPTASKPCSDIACSPPRLLPLKRAGRPRDGRDFANLSNSFRWHKCCGVKCRSRGGKAREVPRRPRGAVAAGQYENVTQNPPADNFPPSYEKPLAACKPPNFLSSLSVFAPLDLSVSSS